MAIGRQDWIARWTNIGDHHCLLGESNIKNGAVDEATEAWLCALTAFEVARRLVDEDDTRSADLSDRVVMGIQRLKSSLVRQIEQVKIAPCDESELLAYYLPAGDADAPAPAIICISMENETGATLLGRLLPVVIGRGMSVLVISHDDIPHQSRGQSEALLSCCLEYLSVRPDVDAARIGVFGEGLSAALATDLAASDRSVAAAVCDGGLWNWTRTRASISWITRAVDGAVERDATSARRAQLKCPALVVTGGRGIVSLSEAIRLQADCIAAGADLDLAVPRIIRSPGAEIENFVTSDDSIFGWLEHKLSSASGIGKVDQIITGDLAPRA
ncbi:alpha/beta hydrolase [Bradyrhizobium sp. 151]|uniref:alpha/beta hydrolase family protein n=1 Tax=Bradyrhizobium sp. 151 TaxID=2782626 RepID=UPI001FF93D77|nr:alpha/beta hydrolase [Bradyrhizobium sp. 151]